MFAIIVLFCNPSTKVRIFPYNCAFCGKKMTMCGIFLFIFERKVWLFKIKAVPLCHENPPSLFTMLKSAGRFVLLCHIIQRHTHHQLSW